MDFRIEPIIWQTALDRVYITGMSTYEWTNWVKPLYEKAVQQYRAGQRDPATFFDVQEQEALATIGASPMELYDFAEDADSLTWETALLILAVRRDYFLVVQHGIASSRRLSIADFPAKDAEIDGIPWLPRLIQKAQGRLRGELPNDLMYCCGGDRRFFRTYNLHPADFLRLVWAVEGNESRVLAYIKSSGRWTSTSHPA